MSNAIRQNDMLHDRHAENAESVENVNFYKKLLCCSKLLATDPVKIFGEGFTEDNICSFITADDGTKDFLIIDNGNVYLIPFTQSFEKSRTRKRKEMIDILENYYIRSSQKNHISPHQFYEFLIGGLITDHTDLKMKSIYSHEHMIYDYIKNNKKKTLETYRTIGELNSITDDYPFEKGISICVNGIEYTSKLHPDQKLHYDTVMDLAGEPLTDTRHIGKFFSKGWILAYVNTLGEVFIVKSSEENEQRLIDKGYKKQQMKVPFASGNEKFVGFEAFYSLSHPKSFHHV